MSNGTGAGIHAIFMIIPYALYLLKVDPFSFETTLLCLVIIGFVGLVEAIEP